MLALKVLRIPGKEEVLMPLTDTDIAWLVSVDDIHRALQMVSPKQCPWGPSRKLPWHLKMTATDSNHYLMCTDVADKKKKTIILLHRLYTKTDTGLTAVETSHCSGYLGLPHTLSWAPFFCSDKKKSILYPASCKPSLLTLGECLESRRY